MAHKSNKVLKAGGKRVRDAERRARAGYKGGFMTAKQEYYARSSHSRRKKSGVLGPKAGRPLF